MTNHRAQAFLTAIWTSAGGEISASEQVTHTGLGALPSVFAVSDLAAGAIGAAALAASSLIARRHGRRPGVRVDRRLASFWFRSTLCPDGWDPPPAWDPVAGDYATEDGWIRLHTNAPHHRAAAMAVLRTPGDKDAVARAVAHWQKDALEAAVVAAGGCAAAMRGLHDWASHPQGQAVTAEPLIRFTSTTEAPTPDWTIPRDRPLRGIRILDLTRVLAGPVATRFLAGLGAEVLRIDPPGWDEPSLFPEVTLGKRMARLDLKQPEGRATFSRLLAEADVLVHGYRADALERLGLGDAWRQSIRPGLIDVAHDAYGWTGPWNTRRGFDSLVQMSSGIADAGMRRMGLDRPHPLPVQALDHACGYAVATAVLAGIGHRLDSGRGWIARTSLARIAALLVSQDAVPGEPGLTPERDDDFAPDVEVTAWGPAFRMRPPVVIDGAPLRWDHPASRPGSAPAAWT